MTETIQLPSDIIAAMPAAKPRNLVRRERLNRFALCLCGIVAAIAAEVLAGWLFDLEFLKRLRPGFVAMNPMTAVCFLAGAVAVALCAIDRRKTTTLPWVLACAAIVFIVGGAKLLGLLLNFDTGVDRLLFASKVNAPAAANPMAPNTALNFIFIGTALFFLRVRQRRLRAFASLFAMITGFQGFVAISGYVYRIAALYGIRSSIPMAPHTAACFVLLSGAIVAVEARRALWSVFLGDGAGARMARRLFPAALLIPAATSWLSLIGEQMGVSNPEFGLAFGSVANMAALGGIICCSALSLSRSEIKRASMERRLRRAHAELETRVRERTEELCHANERLRVAREDLEERVRERTAKLVETQSMLQGIADHAGSLIYVKDIEGKFVLVNGQVASLLGVPETDILGRSGDEFYPKEIADRFRENDLTALRAGANTEFEESLPRPDGVHTYISSKFPLRDQTGKTYALGCVSTDITALKATEAELRAKQHDLEVAAEANQLIMDHSKDVIATVDVSGRFVTVSAAARELWGYPPEELVGRHYTRVVVPEDIPKTDAVVTRIMAGEKVADFESRCVRQDGSLVFVLWSLSWSPADETMFVVAHDVSEQAEAHELLRRAEAEANRASRAKSEFLSRMSHELRTPMNAILGFAQLLEMDDLAQRQRESLEHIMQGGKHLLDLINEVLDISRIEAGRMSLSVEPVEVSETLKESFALVQPLARQYEIRLNGPIGCESVYVSADRQRLKQVFINLLSNAVKYNRPKGTVTVTCEPIGPRMRMAIADTGLGIPEDKREQLFIPFERLGAEQSAIEGTGLGLALAKRLVEAMNGTMGMESTVGQGSVFWIELPVTESPACLVELPEPGPAPQINHTGTHTVLYIEDNFSNLRLVERLFDLRPALKLVVANSGEAGLNMARLHQPQLILLDLNLPDMNGHDVLMELRASAPTAELPVVVLSADATAGQRTRLLEAGAFAYLTKPLDVKKFFEVLDRAIAERASNGATSRP